MTQRKRTKTQREERDKRGEGWAHVSSTAERGLRETGGCQAASPRRKVSHTVTHHIHVNNSVSVPPQRKGGRISCRSAASDCLPLAHSLLARRSVHHAATLCRTGPAIRRAKRRDADAEADEARPMQSRAERREQSRTAGRSGAGDAECRHNALRTTSAVRCTLHCAHTRATQERVTMRFRLLTDCV